MKRLVFGLVFILLTSASLYPQSATERSVLEKVRNKFAQGGGVNFSSLYNSEDFSQEERNFLGRLYEVFFAIPAFLKSEFESTGKIPSRQQIASSYGISPQSVNLLLSVMEADPRVPPLFSRDPESKEITSLNHDNIDAFLASKGSQVRMIQWEGKSLPEFVLTTFDGDRLRSKDLKGHPSLLYIWFTGCPPCVRIAPILADLEHEYPAVKFVGLNADQLLEIQTDNAARKAYVNKQGIEFVNANLDSAAREAFGNVNVYPTLFLVDAGGVIRRHFINFQDRSTLAAALQQLVQ